MTNVHDITKQFEAALCEYTGAPHAVCVDNASNALFLALKYCKVEGQVIEIPKHTYPSVAMEIIHAGAKVAFYDSSPYLKGSYLLNGSRVIDAALSFTADMFMPGNFMCLSFTGPYKHLKLGKGGAILTNDPKAYAWFKKARFSGRDECSYHIDDFDKNPVVGWNFYMPVETAARGLHMITQFYNADGSKKKNEDLSLPYPDLSKFKIFYT